MPLTFLPQGPQNDSPGRIGDMILSASNRARTEGRQAALLKDERAREDKLLDDERKFRKEETADARKARLEDDLALTRQREQEAILRVLEREGLLKGNDRNDPAKVQRAVDISATRGKLKEYEPLIVAGHLLAEDAADDAKVQVAMNKAGAVTAGERTRKGTQQTQGDALAQDTEDRRAAASKTVRDINAKLNTLAADLNPEDIPPAAVDAEALRMAVAATGKKDTEITPKELAAQRDAATKKLVEIAGRRMLNAQQQAAILQRQLATAADSLTDLDTLQRQLSGQGFLPARRAAVSDAPSIIDVPTGAAGGNPTGGFLGRKTGSDTGQPPPAASRAAALNVPTLPGNDPLIAAENERRAMAARQRAAAPAQQAIQQATARLAQIQSDIDRLRQGEAPTQGRFAGIPARPGDKYYRPGQGATAADPSTAAILLSELLQEQQKIQAQLSQAQEIVRQAAPAASQIVTPPPVSAPAAAPLDRPISLPAARLPSPMAQSAPTGRPITPSANIFPTSAPQKWWA